MASLKVSRRGRQRLAAISSNERRGFGRRHEDALQRYRQIETHSER